MVTFNGSALGYQAKTSKRRRLIAHDMTDRQAKALAEAQQRYLQATAAEDREAARIVLRMLRGWM
ncbi:MAG: hypothetical protein O7A04_06760 [Acidobacteria bacterium]|nr:hypothetical protein [Acidobacteriota bacterium]